jgi:toxin ParE1/3/4
VANVRWTRPAVSDLLEVFRYVALDDPAAARSLCDRLRDATRLLADHPQMGREVPELGNPAVREIGRGSYRIIYRARRDVQILAVIEGHRELPEDVSGR